MSRYTDELMHDGGGHARTRAGHKYLLKIENGNNPRYIYTQEELAAYRAGGSGHDANLQRQYDSTVSTRRKARYNDLHQDYGNVNAQTRADNRNRLVELESSRNALNAANRRHADFRSQQQVNRVSAQTSDDNRNRLVDNQRSYDAINAANRRHADFTSQQEANRQRRNSVSGNSVSGNSVSGNSVSGNSVSGNSVSGNSVSGNSVSGNSVSGNSVRRNGPSFVDQIKRGHANWRGQQQVNRVSAQTSDDNRNRLVDNQRSYDAINAANRRHADFTSQQEANRQRINAERESQRNAAENRRNATRSAAGNAASRVVNSINKQSAVNSERHAAENEARQQRINGYHAGGSSRDNNRTRANTRPSSSSIPSSGYSAGESSRDNNRTRANASAANTRANASNGFDDFVNTVSSNARSAYNSASNAARNAYGSASNAAGRFLNVAKPQVDKAKDWIKNLFKR